MKEFKIKHIRSTSYTTVKAKSRADLWRKMRKEGGEPTNYRILN